MDNNSVLNILSTCWRKNSDHSALAISTSGLYFLPQYTVIDSVISDIIANYDICIFALL